MDKWTQEQEQILIANYLNIDYKSLSNILQKTESAIRAKCFELRLVKNDRWSAAEIDFLKENYSKMPKSEIAKYLNRTETSVKVKANKIGIKRYPYICDYNFFKNIDSEEKAYWLGFIYADGWISINRNTNSGVVGIQLQLYDEGHLKKFNKSINGNYKIITGERNCTLNTTNPDKLNKYCQIRIYSIDMVKDLMLYGVNSNKSYNITFPNLQEQLIRHFIRGFFDGDGCVRTRIRKLASGKNKKYPSCDISCHEKNFLDSIRSHIYSKGINSYIYPDKTNFRLYPSGLSDNLSFLDYIYKDSIIYLDRKYKRYQEIKKYTEQDCLAS